MSGVSDRPCDLVTGATGMLGSHIAERLVARGRRVRALVRPAQRYPVPPRRSASSSSTAT